VGVEVAVRVAFGEVEAMQVEVGERRLQSAGSTNSHTAARLHVKTELPEGQRALKGLLEGVWLIGGGREVVKPRGS
jgi:hypothetical protein